MEYDCSHFSKLFDYYSEHNEGKKLSNKELKAVHFLTTKTSNIIDTIEFILTFVDQRMNHTYIKNDRGRENLDAYPQRALFEGVVNAVAHRNYFLFVTQIQIDMFRDRLEISSPRSFYHGEPIEKTYNLSQYLSTRRNLRKAHFAKNIDYDKRIHIC